MEFVAGKYYRTRDNRKVYCIGENVMSGEKTRWMFAMAGGLAVGMPASGRWKKDGDDDDWDIVAEWQEPTMVTRWRFAYVRQDGSDSTRECESKQYAEREAKRLVDEAGFRVGPIEEITTVVP